MSPVPTPSNLQDVPFDARPRHIAIIMDGNGRWAEQRGRPRMEGHGQGADTTQRIVAEGVRLGLEAMTLYSFSMENWKRPTPEIQFLMELCSQRLRLELPMMLRHNLRFVHVGRREGLPQRVLDDIDETTRLTARHTGMKLAFAWNYGGRGEITDACRAIAGRVAEGRLDPADITEQTLADHLYTAGLPDPDLLIRTGGQMRLSNFLLWQVSYAELWITPTLWPEFTEAHLHEAIRDYATRQRKFGGLAGDNV